ncbi:hypothetical protein E4U21_002602 [Claviceps maximensis]|nr:hypothetical protein E4U21_002602 [Claviceps maximensis]
MVADSSSPTKRELTTSTENKDVDVVEAATRLHITPLDRDLLKVVLPASVLPHARNISLHTIETFPEKRYGYVDLPAPEAEKLRKRLNGTTFKGLKMRVEKARQEDRSWEVVPGKQTEEERTKEEEKKEKKKKKKRKAADEAQAQGGASKRRRDTLNVVEGYLLTDRKVKRGWTESTDTKVKNKRSSKEKDQRARDDEKEKEKQKRKRLRSKYTDRDECLLKTRLPPNAVANLAVDSEAYRTMMAKSSKKKQKNQDRKDDGGGGGVDAHAREVIVHEFERTTTFPSFLKHVVPERQGKEAVEFVDGRGWVDEDGNLVEAVGVKTRTGSKGPGKKTETEREMQESSSDDDDCTSSSGTSSEGDSESESDSDSDSDSQMETSDSKTPKNITAAQSKERRPSTKDSITTSVARPWSSSSPSSQPPDNNKHNSQKPQDTRPISSSSSRSLTIKIPALPPTTPTHPLEALYKRPKPDDNDNASSATASAPAPSFSFFSNDPPQEDMSDDDDENTDAPAPVPMTPFTRQDFEWRNVRSAAPTPDTAHPARGRNLWGLHDEEDDGQEDDDEQQEGQDEAHARPDGQQDASDFQSWFWENRRSLNQAWMTRRKTAAKEKRHRENKSRASKAI